jgi:predicted dehydrogenase
MSKDPKIVRASAADWFLERAYTSYEEMARAEAAHVEGGKVLFALTRNYTDYPAVREARKIVRLGQLGEIRKAMVG